MFYIRNPLQYKLLKYPKERWEDTINWRIIVAKNSWLLRKDLKRARSPLLIRGHSRTEQVAEPAPHNPNSLGLNLLLAGPHRQEENEADVG